MQTDSSTGKNKKEENKTIEKQKMSVWAEIWQYKWLYFWIALASCFGVFIYFWQGTEQAIDYFSGYLIELSLSVDNLFVFLLIFISFGITEHAQHKVLNYGILGTIILRFVFIFLGISLINKFEWLLWVLGALLIFSGGKMFKHDEEGDPRDGILYKMIAKVLPMSVQFEGEKFVVRNNGTNYDKSSPLSRRSKKLLTPLAVVMVLIIFSDVIFAIDSVPAVISMTRDMFIVYTSNMFAIMGLRQMFFVLEHMHERFQYVKYGVAIILIFTGVKMLLGIFDFHIHNLISIAVIIVVLTAAIVISAMVTKRKEKKDADSVKDNSDLLEEKKQLEKNFAENDNETME